MFFTVCILVLVPVVRGHWVPEDGHKMHYPQLPDRQGWDVCLSRMAVADDFRCGESGAITDIHIWVSWKDDIVDEVIGRYVGIHEDANGQPGKALWKLGDAKIAWRDEEPSLQGWLCPCEIDPKDQVIEDNHTKYALINITEIEEPFKQEEGMRYWLVVHLQSAITDVGLPQANIGWKTSINHFGMPAMWTKLPMSSTVGWVDVPSPAGDQIDMAFVITGEDVPSVPLDFGDTDETKCDGTVAKCNTYPTTLARNGARHVIRPGIFMGNPDLAVIQIDAEDDGQPTLLSNGDDLNGIDDEEAVKLPAVLVPGTTATAEISVSVDGFMDAWIDFNDDGDWDDWGEKIFNSRPVTQGPNVMVFYVPNTISDHAERQTYSRFRFSTTGGLNYYGLAKDGEVEDYLVTINPDPYPKLDFGDTPDGDFVPSGYPTLRINNGARHKIDPRVRLGRYIDGERDGQPTIGANGDDLADIDDEDGVFFGGPLVPGQDAEVKVIASCDGLLWAWVDMNNDGDWDDTGERIFAGKMLAAGVNYLKFHVTPGLYAGPFATYARFRFVKGDVVGANLGYSGPADNGEVEDYMVKVVPEPLFDFGDAPELRCDDDDIVRCNTYPTTLARNGARHLVDRSIYLGNPFVDCDCPQIDAEQDGQPTLAADGDDTNDIDDEEGVEFLTPMIPGLPAKVRVWASVDGYLDAWVDFNHDGDWDDFGEHIFGAEKVYLGDNDLKFDVPPHPHAIALDTRTYARFRYNTFGPLHYGGAARNGEVEDYLVRIEEPEEGADLGDAPDSSNSFNVNMTAYTSMGPLPVTVKANYPTVYRIGSPPYGPYHWQPKAIAHLGADVSLEVEADFGYDEDMINNLIPPRDLSNRDRADDGVKVPLVLPSCGKSDFDYIVRVNQSVKRLYVNVWLDFNRDGDWDDVIPIRNCNSDSAARPVLVREWAVSNQLLTELSPGIYRFTTPPFVSWHPWVGGISGNYVPPIWMRITLSARPWEPPATFSALSVGYGGSGPARGYWIGETEDYFFTPILHCRRSPDLNCDHIVSMPDLAIMASQWLEELIYEVVEEN